MTYDQFLENLRTKQNFSFSRWGDGEFNCMLQTRPGKANCDGNYYYPELGKALAKIIESAPPYYMGMQGLAKRLFPDAAARLMLNGSEWIDADILHKASQDEGLSRLWEATIMRNVWLVGPEYLYDLSKNKCATWLSTLDRNSWNSRVEILCIIEEAICDVEDCVLFISAGMAANFFVDELYKKYGTRHTFIDAGSVFDPYCGRNSRKYHSQIIERLNGNKGSIGESGVSGK